MMFPRMPGGSSFGGGFGRGSFRSLAQQAQRMPVGSLDRDMLEARIERQEREEQAKQPAAGSAFIVGLDLGLLRDPTALVINERTGNAPDLRHNIRHIHRYPLGTPYPQIVRAVTTLVGQIPAKPEQITLTIDATGVGLGILAMFREARLPCKLVGVMICSGRQVRYDEQSKTWHVSKHELVGSLLKVVGCGRLAVAKLPMAHILQREMQTLSIKVTTSGGETVEALREKDHDDVVLAVAMAVFFGERQRRQLANAMTRGG